MNKLTFRKFVIVGSVGVLLFLIMKMFISDQTTEIGVHKKINKSGRIRLNSDRNTKNIRLNNNPKSLQVPKMTDDVESMKNKLRLSDALAADRGNEVVEVINGLIERMGPYEAIKFAQTLPVGRGRFNLIALSLVRISRNDRIEAYRIYQQLDTERDTFSSMLPNLFAPSKGIDPQNVFADIFRILPPGNDRDNVVSCYFETLGMEDISEAYKILESKEISSTQRAKIEDTLLRMEIVNSPATAFEKIKTLPLNRIGGAINDLVNYWPISDIQSLNAWIQNQDLGLEAKRGATLSIVGRFLDVDLDAGMTFLNSLDANSVSDNAYSMIVKKAATQDLNHAFSLTNIIQSPIARELALQAVYEVFSIKEPKMAIVSYLSSSNIDQKHSEIGNKIIHSWASRNPQEAESWLVESPQLDSRLKKQFGDVLAVAVAESNYMEFVKKSKVERNLLENEQAVNAAVLRYSNENPQESMAWMIESNLLNSSRVTQTFSRWLDFQPIEAAKWLSGAKISTEYRDQSIGLLIQNTYRDSPEAALEWADQVVDQKSKNEYLGIIYKYINKD